MMVDFSMGVDLMVFMGEVALPSSTEEGTIIDGSESVPKSNEFLNFNMSEFLNRGYLERWHHTRKTSACTANIRQNGLEDGALDDGAVE